MDEYLILATEVDGFRVTAVQVNHYRDHSYAYSGTVSMELGVPNVELIQMQSGQPLPAPDNWKDLIIDRL